MREELNKSKSRGEWTDTGDLARELPALAGRRPGAEACKEAGWTLEVGLLSLWFCAARLVPNLTKSPMPGLRLANARVLELLEDVGAVR